MGRIIAHPSCFISLNVRLACLIFTPSPFPLPLSRHEPLSFLPDPRSSAIHCDYCFPCPSISPPPPSPHQASCFKRARCCLPSVVETFDGSRSLFASCIAFCSQPIIHDKSFTLGWSPRWRVRLWLFRLIRPPFLSLNQQPPCMVNDREWSLCCKFCRRGEIQLTIKLFPRISSIDERDTFKRSACVFYLLRFHVDPSCYDF